MTNDELKAIGDLVEQKIESALKPVKDKLDNHTVSLMSIEQTLGGYSDMYKINKDKNVELDERVTKIETHLGIPSQK
jgi:hypothetical protein